jgi:hypothetical protein
MAKTTTSATTETSGASITTLDDTPAVAEPTFAAPVAVSGDTSNKVLLMIHQEKGENGKEAVFLGVNGDQILVPRGQYVPVDKKFVEACLDDAIQLEYDAGDQGKDMTGRPVPRFAYTIKPMPLAA